MWLDDLPPLPLTPPDEISPFYATSVNWTCIGGIINDDADDDVLDLTDNVIAMTADDVIAIDVVSRYRSRLSIDSNGDIVVFNPQIL